MRQTRYVLWLLLGLCWTSLAALEAPLGDGPASASADPAWRDALRQQAPPWYDARRDDYTSLRPPPPEAAPSDASGKATPGDDPSDRRSTTGTRTRNGDDAQGFSRPASAAGSIPALSWVLGTLLVLAVLAVVVVAVRTWMQTRPAESRPTARPRTAVQIDEVEVEGLVLRVDELDDAMAKAARAGDWARVAVLAYARMLEALATARLITLRRGTTNRGYLAELQRALGGLDAATRDGALAACRRVVQLFERTWFGRMAVLPAEGEQAQADARLVNDRAGRWRAAADAAAAVGSGAQRIPVAAGGRA